MAKKKRDPVEEYNRGMDILFEKIEEKRDAVLFARLKAVGTNVSDAEIQMMIDAFRQSGVKNGKTVSQARTDADVLLYFGLDKNFSTRI